MRLHTYLSPGIPVAVFETLAGVLGADLHVVTAGSGPEPDRDPFRSGDADLGWMCSTGYLPLAEGPEPSVRMAGVAWVPADPEAAGRPVYFAEIVTRADGPRSLDEVRGARLAVNDPQSLSGFHALVVELARRATNPDQFARLTWTGGHQRSLDALLAGGVDAAVVDSVALAARASTDASVRGLRVAARLGPWPTQPLVASTRIDPGAVDEVAAALLAANDDPAVRGVLRRAAIDRLVGVGAGHCDPVAEALGFTPARAEPS